MLFGIVWGFFICVYKANKNQVKNAMTPLSLKNYKTIISTLVITSYFMIYTKCTQTCHILFFQACSGQGHQIKGKQGPVWGPVWVFWLKRGGKNDLLVYLTVWWQWYCNQGQVLLPSIDIKFSITFYQN